MAPELLQEPEEDEVSEEETGRSPPSAGRWLGNAAGRWAGRHPLLSGLALVMLYPLWIQLNSLARVEFGDLAPFLLAAGTAASVAAAAGWVLTRDGDEDFGSELGPRGRAAPAGPLARLRLALGALWERTLAVLDPGREQAGEVIQETESGRELHLADTEPLVKCGARVVALGMEEATKALGQAAQEVMGVAHDVVAGKPPGTSAAVQELRKDMEAESRVTAGGFAEADDLALPTQPSAGYESDSDVPGDVLRGVHPRGGTKTQ